MKVVALAGGTGAAKFLRGLAAVMPPEDLTIIGNTGDDLEMWGLFISPDLDTVAYTLAGLIDETKGWGVKHDTFACRDVMATLGLSTYFGLGDRDLALHLARSERLRRGEPLSRVTAELGARLGLKCRLVPMTDQRVATHIETPAGWLAFQEFFVRERCQPDVLGVRYDGAEHARAAPGVVEALLSCDRVIVCPSNPISSIGPILAVAELQRALFDTQAAIVAVSPIVGSAPVSGPAGKMMAAAGAQVSPLGVAKLYAPWLTALIIDESDQSLGPALADQQVQAIAGNAIMRDRESAMALARLALEARL